MPREDPVMETRRIRDDELASSLLRKTSIDDDESYDNTFNDGLQSGISLEPGSRTSHHRRRFDWTSFSPLWRLRPWRRRGDPSSIDASSDKCLTRRRRRSFRLCRIIMISLLVILGTIHLFGFLLSIVGFVFWGEDLESIVSTWGQPGQKGGGMSRWPTDFSSDITPIPCHSHNDYWRHVPLYSAISAGCIGVEADVWLFDEELYVGHNTASLTRNRTLRNLYIDPLVEILDKQNPITDFANATHHGVFDTDPSQTLTLLIDFKTLGSAIWPYVVAQLEPLRQRKYLTIFNGTDMIPGPITVVGTGNTPFDLVLASNTRDIFFDAPLDEMWENREWEEAHKWPKWNDEEPGEVLVEDEGSAEEDKNFRDHPGGNGRHAYKSWQKSHPKAGNPADSQGTGARRSSSKSSPENDDITPTKLVHDEIYTSQNSYYASVSFGKTIGRMWRNRLSHRQMGLIRGQIRGAHRRGLKVRYWDLPNWPIGLRNHVWNVLVREGVDLLNVDDLKGATRTDWRRRDNWW